MNINIDLNELAAEITRKIRDEMSGIKIVDFGEVKGTTNLSNGGWTATVLLPGAETLTNPLNCLSNYIPKIGDWVMIIYPPKSEPVLVDATPMRSNAITTPDDKYANATDHNHDDRYYTEQESDEKYAAATHDHDGRYYTKTLSDERYAAKNHTHEGYAAADHTHDDYVTKVDLTDQVPEIFDNGWDQDAAAPVKYFKDHSGVVHMRGKLKMGVNGSSAFTLAAGYMPDQERTEMVWANDGAADIPGMIKIMTDGTVVPQHGSAGWISLDGISYKTI